MSIFRILIVSSLISFAHADTATDAFARFLTDLRTTTNKTLSKAAEGSCSTIVAQAHAAECRQKSLTHESVEKLSMALSKINLLKKQEDFIARAHGDQVAAMECEIAQLRALYNEESVKPFYGQVLGDICQKLPDLRLRANKMRELQTLIDSANSKLASAKHMNNYSVPVSNKEILALDSNVKTWTKKLQLEQSIFLQMKASIWRFEDAAMEELVNKGISSESEGKQICEGGGAVTQYDRYHPSRQKFQETVILPMIQRAQSDLSSLGQSPKEIGVAGMQVLLAKANWHRYQDPPKNTEDLSNALMMCDFEQKFTKGDERTQKFLTVGSFAVGGTGMFLKLAKFATMLKPQTIQILLGSSRLLLMASTFPSVPVSLEQVGDACFQRSQSYDLKGRSCPRTSTGNIDVKAMVDIETKKIESDNCALNVLLSSVELAPGVGGFLKGFKRGPANLEGLEKIVKDPEKLLRLSWMEKLPESILANPKLFKIIAPADSDKLKVIKGLEDFPAGQVELSTFLKKNKSAEFFSIVEEESFADDVRRYLTTGECIAPVKKNCIEAIASHYTLTNSPTKYKVGKTEELNAYLYEDRAIKTAVQKNPKLFKNWAATPAEEKILVDALESNPKVLRELTWYLQIADKNPDPRMHSWIKEFLETGKCSRQVKRGRLCVEEIDRWIKGSTPQDPRLLKLKTELQVETTFEGVVRRLPQLSGVAERVNKSFPSKKVIIHPKEIPFNDSNKFRDVDELTMILRADDLDPKTQAMITTAYNALNDRAALIPYFENLHKETVLRLVKKGALDDLKKLEVGEVSYRDLSLTVIQRLKANGDDKFTTILPKNRQLLQTGKLNLPDEVVKSPNGSFRGAVRTGPFIDKTFKEDVRDNHGVYSHMIQREIASEALKRAGYSPDEFFTFLGTKKGINWWVDIFDAGAENSLNSPEKMTKFMTHAVGGLPE
jgi:hypothetical protein